MYFRHVDLTEELMIQRLSKMLKNVPPEHLDVLAPVLTGVGRRVVETEKLRRKAFGPVVKLEAAE